MCTIYIASIVNIYIPRFLSVFSLFQFALYWLLSDPDPASTAMYTRLARARTDPATKPSATYGIAASIADASDALPNTRAGANTACCSTMPLDFGMHT